MSKFDWTPAAIPDQTGLRIIITGGNSGIGFYTALELARHGAEVVVAARDATRGADAKARILAEVPSANLTVEPLDVSSLASVRTFAAAQRDTPLHILINNAGIYAPPKRGVSKDGFELQLATNVLGHFALTALLLPTLSVSSGTPRIVTVASIAHKAGKLSFDDLQSERPYNATRAYQQSKLANLILAFELDRRLRAAGSPIQSITAHPGLSNTNIFQVGNYSAFERKTRQLFGVVVGKLFNDQPEGAIPTLYAATAPEAQPGGYYGPQSFFETRGGDVGPAKVAPQALDQAGAKRLWEICEQLTGCPLLN